MCRTVSARDFGMYHNRGVLIGEYRCADVVGEPHAPPSSRFGPIPSRRMAPSSADVPRGKTVGEVVGVNQQSPGARRWRCRPSARVEVLGREHKQAILRTPHIRGPHLMAKKSKACMRTSHNRVDGHVKQRAAAARIVREGRDSSVLTAAYQVALRSRGPNRRDSSWSMQASA